MQNYYQLLPIVTLGASLLAPTARVPAASISGQVFFDFNRNGVRDAMSENGLPGWTVNLSGQSSGSVPTDAAGAMESRACCPDRPRRLVLRPVDRAGRHTFLPLGATPLNAEPITECSFSPLHREAANCNSIMNTNSRATGRTPEP
jgi:hypothetical protein